ncbi:hypothetical protein MUS1_09590 [Marinomonas ushuaiensis DSM 15871]|uniref:Uncharacterized protein n=1 Tax=Marinomonas ushuaiensis DSM 15871 TaxID=1122207 RepID=X7E6S5_9GAMM|nr:hypothetical protein [Marinomonas ushuaiensis]ETX11662.1 hypothetical protein MUS1_09590 [Marinomonas ushuaiensis DSM 15871]
MQVKSKIDLIRMMTVCHLYLEDQRDDKNELEPIQLLSLTESGILSRFKHHFINTAKYLNSKSSTYTAEIDSVESADNESERQAQLIYDMTAIEFINLISNNNAESLILDHTKLEWLKKDRITLYKINAILANFVRLVKFPNRRNNTMTPMDYSLRLDGNETLIHNGMLPHINKLSTDELYLSTLITLDNIDSFKRPIVRHKRINSIKSYYFNIDKLVHPLQDFVSKHPKYIQKSWAYLLKKREFQNHGGIYSRFNINYKVDRETLEYLIIEIGYENRKSGDKIKEIDRLLRKVWSVENTRKRDNIVKPITLSKKNYEKLQTLCKQNGVSEKKFISDLIDREQKKMNK